MIPSVRGILPNMRLYWYSPVDFPKLEAIDIASKSDDCLKDITRLANIRIIVGELDNLSIGYYAFTVHKKKPSNRISGDLYIFGHRAAILPNWRRRLVGSFLVEAAERNIVHQLQQDFGFISTVADVGDDRLDIHLFLKSNSFEAKSIGRETYQFTRTSYWERLAHGYRFHRNGVPVQSVSRRDEIIPRTKN